jgi:hypothetical protein
LEFKIDITKISKKSDNYVIRVPPEGNALQNWHFSNANQHLIIENQYFINADHILALQNWHFSNAYQHLISNAERQLDNADHIIAF